MSLLNFATQDTAVLFTVLTIALTLVKILEAILVKILPNKNKVLSEDEFDRIKSIENRVKSVYTKVEDKPTLSDEQNSMLRDLYELHSRSDADGIPLHYFPRSFIESQKDVVEVLQEISSHQEKTTYLLEQVMKKMERLEDKIVTIKKD